MAEKVQLTGIVKQKVVEKDTTEYNTYIPEDRQLVVVKDGDTYTIVIGDGTKAVKDCDGVGGSGGSTEELVFDVNGTENTIHQYYVGTTRDKNSYVNIGGVYLKHGDNIIVMESNNNAGKELLDDIFPNCQYVLVISTYDQENCVDQLNFSLLSSGQFTKLFKTELQVISDTGSEILVFQRGVHSWGKDSIYTSFTPDQEADPAPCYGEVSNEVKNALVFEYPHYTQVGGSGYEEYADVKVTKIILIR